MGCCFERVRLNKKRRAEEEQGHVRYLRPEYQAPEEMQAAMELDADISIDEAGELLEPQDWPETMAERARLVRQVVEASEEALTVEDVARRFRYARRKQVQGLLETLEALGQASRTGEGLWGEGVFFFKSNF